MQYGDNAHFSPPCTRQIQKACMLLLLISSIFPYGAHARLKIQHYALYLSYLTTTHLLNQLNVDNDDVTRFNNKNYCCIVAN